MVKKILAILFGIMLFANTVVAQDTDSKAACRKRAVERLKRSSDAIPDD